MQFMALFTRHPDKADNPAPADLREAEFETVRGFYADGLVQQVISVNLFWLLRVELLLLCFAYSRRLSQLSGNVGPILD